MIEDSIIKEPTFEICEHDKENPYVMISRNMAQDKSISPKAKGVLLYLLSLPKNWKIYHSQLQNGLGIGEDYLNSALEELILTGYADRSRERVKGLFQPYRYKIREFKKCSPNLENQPGSSSPENPVIQSKESSFNKETATNPKPIAAVPKKEEKKEEVKKPTIYSCLEAVEIHIRDKIEITKVYDEKRVIDGVAWSLHPDNPTKKCLAAQIKFACKNELSLKDLEKKKVETPYEKVKKIFKHLETFNEAECYLYPEYIGFVRGQLNDRVNFDKFFEWSKLQKLCEKFKIPIPEKA